MKALDSLLLHPADTDRGVGVSCVWLWAVMCRGALIGWIRRASGELVR
jgi:hypothetical protein